MSVLSPLLMTLMLRLTTPAPGSQEDERGASAVEYGLLVAGIAAVIVGAVFLFGQGIFVHLFTNTCNSIAQNMASGC
jgi:pilus assembly protein Flp/PilA